jgi:hypothetical protein
MDIASLRRLKPELADLSDEEVVRYVAADYPSIPLQKIASDLGVAISAPDAQPARTLGGTIKDIGVSALQGAVAVPEAAVGLADIATGGKVGKALEQGFAVGGINVGFRPEEAQQALQDQYSDPQKAAFQKVQDADGIVGKTVAAVTNPSTIAHSVIQSLPSMAAGGLVGRGILSVGARAMGAEAAAAGSMGPYVVPGTLTRAVASSEVAAGIAGAAGEGITMAGQDAEQIRDKSANKELSGEQSRLAVGIGAGGTLFAMLGARIAKSLGIHDVDTMVAAGHVNDVARKGLTRRVLEGAFSEGILEELPQSVVEQVLQNIANDDPIDKDVDQQAVMGTLAGAAMGGGANMMGGRPPKKNEGPAMPLPDPAAGPLSAAATLGVTQGATGKPADTATLDEAVQKLAADAVKSEPDPREAQSREIDRQARIADAAKTQNVAAGEEDDPFATDKLTPAPKPGSIDAAAHEAATSPTNARAEPTAAQADAGNYKKGHVNINGLDISIENPAGSTREDKANTPPAWSTDMKDHYGYIKRTEGADGDHVDVYVRSGTKPDYDLPVYVIDQVRQDGKGTFDEHKVMLGYRNRAAAVAGYRLHYTRGWQLGRVTEMQFDQFKDWLKNADLKQPASPKGELTPAELKTTQGAPINASEKTKTAPEAAGGIAAGGNAQDAARGGDLRGSVAPEDAPAGVASAAPGREVAAPDAQPAGERVAKYTGEAADHERLSLPWPGRPQGTPIADISVAKRADGTYAAGRGFMLGAGGQGASHVHFKGFATRDEAVKDAIDNLRPKLEAAATRQGQWKDADEADVERAKKALTWLDRIDPTKPKQTLQDRRAQGKAKRDAAQAPAPVDVQKTMAGAVSTGHLTDKQVDQVAAIFDKKPPAENASKEVAGSSPEKFHASISAAEDERKAKGQDTHHIERDRRGLVVRPNAPVEKPESPAAAGAADEQTQPVEKTQESVGPAPAENASKPAGGEQALRVSKNTIVTDEAAEKARAILKAKLSTPMAGIDPEMMQAGITLAIYHIERGARTFAAYSKAMLEQFGDTVGPYLKSWYMAAKYDPRATSIEFDDAATVEAFDVKAPAKPAPGAGLTGYLAERITEGKMPKDNPALKRMVETFDRQEASPARMKEAQEALEAAIVQHARSIAAAGDDTRSTFDKMVALYNSQPNLNVRTSTSVQNQAYSTPAPLAYLASRMAGIEPSTVVLEPTAGTGMLLMQANPKSAVVNELNPDRAALLEAQGFKVTTRDATMSIAAPGHMDAVIANPPFGGLHDDGGKTRKVEVDGFKIGQVDHLIAARALEAMKDNGRAVLILGANKASGGMSEDDRVFFNWLYSNYDVRTHFEVDGSMYTRQGAGWPVRVIEIAGRKSSNEHAPRAGTIERVDTWDKVYERYEQSLDAGRPTDRNGAAGPVGTGNASPGQVRVSRPADGKAAGDGGREPRGGAARTGDEPGSGAGTVDDRRAGKPGRVGRADRKQRLDEQPAAQGGLPAAGKLGEGGGDKPARAPRDGGLTSEDNQFQVQYVPRSSRKDSGVLIPINMAQPLQEALSALEDSVGDIDKFAAKELGYASIDEMHDALMGLQVDSVAAAIHQIKAGKAIIIADQTGIGKGRQAAAIIRWAVKNNIVPVFTTAKPELFSDMYSDLGDIGSHDVAPFILNANEPITTADGQKVHETTIGQRTRALKAMMNGALPEGRNALFMTYSQINSEAYAEKRAAILALASNAIFILDESHNASGESNTGEYIKSLLDQARGTVYLSATYAKRPDNMPLYFKTDMGEAVSDDESLMQAMESGGLPLQTVVSNNLVKSGQMFRRERSYDGVNIETVVDTANAKKHVDLSDRTTSALRAIVAADKMFHNVFVKEMQDRLAEEGKAVNDVAGNKSSSSVDHTQFSSVVHNFVRQMLLGLKADQAADRAIEALKSGKKALIALENTMGSFLGEYASNNGIGVGESLGQFDYRTVLSRALERSRYIVEKDEQGNKEKKFISLPMLDDATRAAYNRAQEIIDYLDLSTPVSPIDWMRKRLTDAGYKVAEITGRDLSVDYSDPAKPKLGQVDLLEQNDKVRTTRLFNAGQLDAIILNVSGSTGISLHASEKFSDQRKRKMIVAQPAQDINIFMQMLGRIHRTGQVALPEYDILATDLPAERRPAALLSRKMKSLNANTSSNTDSATSVEAIDMLNKYGDRIIAAYLDDNPKLKVELGFQPSNMVAEDGKLADGMADIARKATGRLALMPVEAQRQFYDDVEGQYSTMIEYLTRTNQNDLEPRTFDFDAKELKSQKIYEGTNPDSPFGADAVYGEYSVKAQGKPMTPDEIRAEMKEHLAGALPAVHTNDILHRLQPQYDTWVKTLDDATREQAGVVRGNAERFLLDHPIGNVLRVDINGDTYNAIITNIKSTHKERGNPFSMSKIQVTIAVNGSLRHATVPATQFTGIEVSKLPIYSDQWDSYFNAKANDRETAKIITGNLLAAYGELQGVHGTIISFTRQDGSVEQGIMLPKQFQAAENLQGGFRLRTGAEAVKFLHESYAKDIDKLGIASRDNAVRVMPAAGGAIEIRVPKSKAKGAKYFLDKKLLAITGDFISRGDRMVVTVPAKNAAAAIDALNKKTSIYALPSHSDLARQMFGAKIAFDKSGKPRLDGDVRMSQPAFRQGGASTDAKRVGELQAKADQITERWKRSLPVTVVSSVASQAVPKAVRDEAKTRIAAGGAIPAAVYYDGHVWVFADRTSNDGALAESIAHEIKGHFGLRGNFGAELDSIIKQVAQARPAQVAAMMRRTKITNRLEAAEEVLVEMAQKEPHLGFVRRAIVAIRNFLRSLGVKLKLSDEDMIANWILPAAKFVTDGKRTAQPALSAVFSVGPEPFYSALSKGLEAMPDKALSAIGWEGAINALTNKGKAKVDEVEWSGVKDWLHMQSGKVSKDDVLTYLSNNGVRMTESTLSENPGYSEHEATEQQALQSEYSAWLADNNLPALSADDLLADRSVHLTADQRSYVEEFVERWDAVGEDDMGDMVDRSDYENETKFQKWTEPGGTNYRELLLQLPSTKDAQHEFDMRMREKYGTVMWAGHATGAENAEFQKLLDRRNTAPDYTSGHWHGHANVVAHIRVKDRVDSNGRKVLFVEEIQSDWAQQGRKAGFAPETPPERVDKLPEGWNWSRRSGQLDLIHNGRQVAARTAQQWEHGPDLEAKAIEMYNELVAREHVADKLPRAPFVEKTDAWLSLALKRVIKMAVDEGYDRVAFTNGDQNVRRYGLEAHVQGIKWTTEAGGLRDVVVEMKKTRNVPEWVRVAVNDKGVITVAGMREWNGQPLASVLGEDVAAKIMGATEGKMSSLDFKAGGEGMRTFYDTIVPKNIGKLLDKFGGDKMVDVRIPKTDASVEKINYTELRADLRRYSHNEMDAEEFFEAWPQLEGVINGADLEDIVNLDPHNQDRTGPAITAMTERIRAVTDGGKAMVQPGFDVTPAMREKAGPGLPLFSQPAANTAPSADPDGDRMRGFMNMGKSFVEESWSTPGKLNWWHKTFGTPYNLAQRNAPFKRVFDRVQNFLEDVSHYATAAADLAPAILPKLDGWRDLLPKALGGSGKSPLATVDKKAIQAPIWEGTLRYTRDQDGKPIPIGDVEERYSMLDAHERGKMLMSRGIISEADLKRWQNLPIDSFEGAVNNRFEAEFLTAGIRWTDKELRERYGLDERTLGFYHQARAALDDSVTRLALSDMVKLGGKDTAPIADAVMSSKTIVEGADMLRDYLLSIGESDPERADILRDTANKVIDKSNVAEKLLDRGYAPLMRFGHYTVDVVDRETGKREFFGLYEGRFEARAAAEQMADLFPNARVLRGTTSDEAYKQFAGVSVETLELFGQMIGLEAQGSGATHEAFQQYLKLTKSNRSALRRLIERKGIAGFNEDIGRVLAGFIYSNARQTSSNLHMGEIGEAVEKVGRDADGNMRDGELKDSAYRLMKYVQDPAQEAPGLRQLLFAQYIGGSIASALVNMTQPIQVTMPYLSQFGGITKAAGFMRGALATAWSEKTGSEDLDAALKRAEEDGIVAPQEVHQLMAYARGQGALRSGDGTKMGNTLAVGSNAVSRVMWGWGKLFSTAELFNRRVTYVAAWNLARARGDALAAADAFARKAVEETQFVYNKGNRPEWARGAVGATLFTFKQYSISYMELMQRMWTHGGPEGKKAALFGLAMMLMMAGAGGLPFAEDAADVAEAVAERFGYNLSVKTKRRELLNSIFGQVLGGFLDKGVSGIVGVPLDVSGRLGMGNLIPGTGLLKKKQDHTSDVAELAGPAGDFAKRAFQAADKLASGKPVDATMTMAPQAIRNLDKARDMATMGMYRDESGKKVLDTDGYDAFIKGIGFQPNDVAKVQDANRNVQERVATTRLREQEIADEWARRIFEKDPQASQWARDQVRDWNEKNPESPVRIQYAQITKRLRKMNETKAQRIAEAAPKAMRAEVLRELAGGGR